MRSKLSSFMKMGADCMQHMCHLRHAVCVLGHDSLLVCPRILGMDWRASVKVVSLLHSNMK